MPRQAHLILLGIVTLCIYGCTQRNDSGHSFANPVMLTSRDGKLDVDLVAADAAYTIGGHNFQGMLYNGQYMPPVWRLRAGDILTVTLHKTRNTTIFTSIRLDSLLPK